MAGPLFILGGVWLLWCTVHSLLAHPPVRIRLEAILGIRRHVYRFFYNVIAALSLLPVWLAHQQAEGPQLLVWPGWCSPFIWGLRIVSLWLLVWGACTYDMRNFLGLRTVTCEPVGSGEIDEPLVTKGVLRFVRHPWYLAGLLLIWSRDLAARDLVTNIVLSFYFYIGSALEEHRLLARYGEEYRRYLQQVPRFWPRLLRRR